MRYPVLKVSDARLYLARRGSTDRIEIDSLVRSRGEGAELDQGFVAALRGELLHLKARFPERIQKRTEAGAEFEAVASEIVHQTIPVAGEVVGDPEFWIWLTLANFGDLVEWRYDAQAHGADWRNYGVGASGENFLYRLWLRAELGYDESAPDKYHLVRRGDIDFWRSHLFRQSYANARVFARAFVRFQYPEPDSREPRLRIGVIRELVKRLRRVRANLVFEILDEDYSVSLIESELAGLPQGNMSTTT